MFGANCLGRIPFNVVSSAPGKIQQCKIDDAIVHVDRRADVEVLASDLLEVENFRVNFADRSRSPTQTAKWRSRAIATLPTGILLTGQAKPII